MEACSSLMDTELPICRSNTTIFSRAATRATSAAAARCASACSGSSAAFDKNGVTSDVCHMAMVASFTSERSLCRCSINLGCGGAGFPASFASATAASCTLSSNSPSMLPRFPYANRKAVRSMAATATRSSSSGFSSSDSSLYWLCPMVPARLRFLKPLLILRQYILRGPSIGPD